MKITVDEIYELSNLDEALQFLQDCYKLGLNNHELSFDGLGGRTMSPTRGSNIPESGYYYNLSLPSKFVDSPHPHPSPGIEKNFLLSIKKSEPDNFQSIDISELVRIARCTNTIGIKKIDIRHIFELNSDIVTKLSHIKNYC